MQSFLVDLLFLLFLLFSKTKDLIFRSFLGKFNLRVISIGDVLLVVRLTVQDSIDIFQHSLKIFIDHQLSFILRRQFFCFFHQTTQEGSFLLFYFLLFLFDFHLELRIPHISFVALLRTFLSFA